MKTVYFVMHIGGTLKNIAGAQAYIIHIYPYVNKNVELAEELG